MTPRFASKIDPVLEHVLGLLERAENGADPDPTVEQKAIGLRLAEADALPGDPEEWRLARFALVSWIDEILVHGCTWRHGEWWRQNLLEGQQFKVEVSESPIQTNVAGTDFFDKARQAAGLAKKDALEVFYIAVLLGFRGVYGHQDIDPKKHGLAESLPQWLNATAGAIQTGQGRPPIPYSPGLAQGAPPLMGRLELLAALVWFILLATVMVVLALLQQ